MKTQYSERVDAHIYAPAPGEGCQTPEDWRDLAEAALDQAGEKPKTCHKCGAKQDMTPVCCECGTIPIAESSFLAIDTARSALAGETKGEEDA